MDDRNRVNPKRTMTLEQAKDQVAQKHFKMDYRKFYLVAGFPDIIKMNDEAWELYATEREKEAADKAWEASKERSEKPWLATKTKEQFMSQYFNSEPIKEESNG